MMTAKSRFQKLSFIIITNENAISAFINTSMSSHKCKCIVSHDFIRSLSREYNKVYSYVSSSVAWNILRDYKYLYNAVLDLLT